MVSILSRDSSSISSSSVLSTSSLTATTAAAAAAADTNTNNNHAINHNTRLTKRRRMSTDNNNNNNNNNERKEEEEEEDTNGTMTRRRNNNKNNNNNNNANNASSSSMTLLELEDIQQDLAELEHNLRNRQGRGILFHETTELTYRTISRTGDGDAPSGSSATGSGSGSGSGTGSGGRALFDSIGSALSNIRGRLQGVASRCSHHPRVISSSSSPSPSPSSASSSNNNNNATTTRTATTTTTARPTAATATTTDETTATTLTTSLRLLSERLSLAEQSHSTRIPLTLLQSQSQSEVGVVLSSSRREEVTDTAMNVTTANAAVAAAVASQSTMASSSSVGAAVASSLMGTTNNENNTHSSSNTASMTVAEATCTATAAGRRTSLSSIAGRRTSLTSIGEDNVNATNMMVDTNNVSVVSSSTSMPPLSSILSSSDNNSTTSSYNTNSGGGGGRRESIGSLGSIGSITEPPPPQLQQRRSSVLVASRTSSSTSTTESNTNNNNNSSLPLLLSSSASDSISLSMSMLPPPYNDTTNTNDDCGTDACYACSRSNLVAGNNMSTTSMQSITRVSGTVNFAAASSALPEGTDDDDNVSDDQEKELLDTELLAERKARVSSEDHSHHNTDQGTNCLETRRLETMLEQAGGLIFDCDGTLLDTMPRYYESWKLTCDEVGLQFPIERFYACAGRTVRDIFQMLIEEQLIGTTTSNVVVTAEYCEETKRRHHENIQAKSGGRPASRIDVVVDLALQYHGKLPLAVASSGWRDHVLTGLEQAGILHLFDAVVTACDDEVQSPKPAPDIYLVAANRIGIDPSQCIGFEDADLGLQAVNEAGFLYASDVRLLHRYPRNVEARAAERKHRKETENQKTTNDDDDENDDDENDSSNTPCALLYPESIRKQMTTASSSSSSSRRSSRRGSLKLLSEDLRRTTSTESMSRTNSTWIDVDVDEDKDKEKEVVPVPEEAETETVSEEGTVPRVPPRTMELYTWGSFPLASSSSSEKSTAADYQFFESSSSDDDDKKKRTTATALPSSMPCRLPSTTRLGRTTNEIISMSVSPNDDDATQSHCAFVTSFTTNADGCGKVIICGNNAEGQVDPSQRKNHHIPQPILLEVLATHRIKLVSCGSSHTAVITENKSVLSWGSNLYGQLGHRRAPITSPTFKKEYQQSFLFPKGFILTGTKRVSAADIACGDGYTLVLTTRMEVYMAGRERMTGGRTGSIERNNNDTTSDVHSFFQGGRMGQGTGIGSTGDVNSSFFPLPHQCSALRGLPLVGLTAGPQHAVVWTEHGTAYAWGQNEVGQCGREFPPHLSIPVPIAVPNTAQQQQPLSTSPTSRSTSPSPLSSSSSSLTSTFFTNWNRWPSTTTTTTADEQQPQSTTLLSLAHDVTIVEAACGINHTVLLTESGRLLVCGSNAQQQFPSPLSNFSLKVQVIYHPDHPARYFDCVKAGTHHTVLLDDIGCVYEMGNGEVTMKQISNSSSTLSTSTATSLLSTSSNSPISSIEAGGSLNFALFQPPNDISNNQHPCIMIPTMAGVDDLMEAIRQEYILINMRNSNDNDNDDGIAVTDSIGNSQSNSNSTNGSLDSVEDLAGRTEELFRSPAVMNSLFMDPKEIDEMYHTLLYNCPNTMVKQRMATAIEKGMLMGLQSMIDARMMHFESVRFLLLYLQCPLWRHQEEEEEEKKDEDKEEDDEEEECSNNDVGSSKKLPIRFDARGDLLFLLCETILGLPFEGYKALLAWISALYGTAELFVPLLVKPLVFQLNYRFHHRITHGVPLLSGVLLWLHTVNERSENHKLAQNADFHCSGIAEMPMEALFEDLAMYQQATQGQRSSNFFLVAHPFLMSVQVKQELLQVESQMSMVEAAQAGGVSFDPETREFKFKPYYVLALDRNYLLPQTLQAVASATTTELRKSLKIVFKGEDGVDAGGVTKEFFQLLCEKLFDVNTGMWTTSSTNDTWFNPDCTWNGEGYYLVGVLCGIAVYNSVILDVRFPHAIYRKLLRLPLGLEDLIDEDVRNGLKTLLDYDADDAEEIFCLNFEITWKVLGQEQKKELKVGGSEIAVTSDNKEEYVMLYVKWLLVDSIEAQYGEFERGFMKVMEYSSLEILLAEELELLVTGTPELDFYALEQASDYEGGYDPESPVVTNVWKWVQAASLSTQESFLKFCTGSSKAPIGGLSEMPFKIQRAGPDSMQLPTAHTCFNTLLVSDYGDDYEKLADRLGRAVIECEGFGLQ